MTGVHKLSIRVMMEGMLIDSLFPKRNFNDEEN